MTAVMWVLNGLRRVPVGAWVVSGAAGLVFALVLYAQHREASAYEQGKRDAAQGVVFDSVMLSRAAERVAKQMAHTDTVVRRVVVTRTRVESLTVALPDSIRRVPQVDTLVQTVRVLLTDVDTLTHAITSERAAWTEKAKVDSAAISALRILGTAQADTITTLKRRPTKKKAAALAIVSVATVEAIKVIVRLVR